MALEQPSCILPLVHVDSRHVREVFRAEEVTFEQDFFQRQHGALEVGIDVNAQRHPLFGGAILPFRIAVIDTYIDELTPPILGQRDAHHLRGVFFKLLNEFIHALFLVGSLLERLSSHVKYIQYSRWDGIGLRYPHSSFVSIPSKATFTRGWGPYVVHPCRVVPSHPGAEYSRMLMEAMAAHTMWQLPHSEYSRL